MIRIVIDIEENNNVIGTKEVVAAALEHLGTVRVVSVYDGKEKKK